MLYSFGFDTLFCILIDMFIQYFLSNFIFYLPMKCPESVNGGLIKVFNTYNQHLKIKNWLTEIRKMSCLSLLFLPGACVGVDLKDH